jgi:hypothetical protein
MKRNKIENSIVADGGSLITNARNTNNIDIKKLKTKHTVIGFVLGVVSELVAILIYEHFIK